MAKKPSNKNVPEGKLGKLLLQLSFLITFGLCMWAGWSEMDNVGDTVLITIISVVVALFAFQYVFVGLALLAIPVKVAVSFVRNLRR